MPNKSLIITPTSIYGRISSYYLGDFIEAVKAHLAWIEGVVVRPTDVTSTHLRWSTWTEGKVRKAGYVETDGGRKGAMACYKVMLADVQKGVGSKMPLGLC